MMKKSILFFVVGIFIIGIIGCFWYLIKPTQLKTCSELDGTIKTYVYFAMNINDYYHSDHSAYYVSKAIDLFSKYNVGLDLYFTEPVLKAYEKNHPEVIEKIKNSSLVSINYHVRLPHPCDEHIHQLPDINGVCRNFDEMDYEYVVDKVSDFESYELAVDDYDFRMKDYCPHYNENEIGGFDYVKSVFSTTPLFSGSNIGKIIREVHMKVLKSKGLKGYVAYHSEGTDKDYPFKESHGLLERPSDFGFKFEDIIETDDSYNTFVLETQKFSDYDRPSFANILVHDREFYHRGAWYTERIKLPDGTTSDQWEKTTEEQKYYWQAYEYLVKSIANDPNIKIITAKDVFDMYEKCKVSPGMTRTCSELGGVICSSTETCSGSWLDASDTSKCCSGECQIVVVDYEDSPFASQAPYCIPHYCQPYIGYSNSKITGYLIDTGIKWVRLVELELDVVQEPLSENNIGILSGIARPEYPDDMDSHIKEVKDIVKERKDYVKAWLIVNEADGQWRDTSKRYAEYFILTSEAIKSESPDAIVVLCLAGGRVTEGQLSDKGLKFLDAALKNNVGPYFDVLDFHVQGAFGEYKNLEIKASAFRDVFRENGVEEKPFWITEMGSYDGDPTPDHPRQPDYPYQSEKTQASELIKKYVYGLSLGIKKMFWTTMVEWYKYNKNINSYFSNVGLIHNPETDGKSHKKLSYYTYKLMVEKLEGSDWDDIQAIQESNNVYIYKFTKNGKPVWVAWNDNSQEQTITLNVGNINSVKITDAVPKYESGDRVTDYSTTFNTETKSVSNGKIILTLGENPVFVEESEAIYFTPIYFTIFSHNERTLGSEEKPKYGLIRESKSGYEKFRDRLIRVSEMIHNYGMKYSWQTDYVVLEGINNFEESVFNKNPGKTNNKPLLTYLKEDLEVSIEPHAHECVDGTQKTCEDKQYNYADVAYLVKTIGGVKPSPVIGGAEPLYGKTLLRFSNCLQANVYDYKWCPEILTVYNNGKGHVYGADDMTSGIWRPKEFGNDFYAHNPSSKTIYIGPGSYFSQAITPESIGIDSKEYINSLIKKIESGKAPKGKMYTASLFISESPTTDLNYDKFEDYLNT